MNNDKRGKQFAELPAKQKLINETVNVSREQLIRGQLELKFLQGYLEEIKDPDNREVIEPKMFMTTQQAEEQIQVLEEANQYYLSRMRYYKDLKQKSLDKKHEKIREKAMEDYEKLPDKVVINGDKVQVTE